MAKKLKRYKVVKTIIEEYEVYSTSKKQALENCSNPSRIAIKSERAYLKADTKEGEASNDNP